MKKIKIVLGIAALIVALFACHKDELAEKIPISEIPDLAFRNYLIVNFDADNDGFICLREASAVKVIDLSNVSGVTSLKGIEYFTSLEVLIGGGTGMDLSNCLMLRVLNTLNYDISNLNINKNVNLKELYCYSSKPLDLSKNIALEKLFCKGNFETLDLKTNSALQILDCSESGLISLVLPDSKRLKNLNCEKTQIKTFDLNGFELLEEFNFYNSSNQYHTIEKLDISNSSVKRIFCHIPMRNLNLNNLPELEFLSITSTKDKIENHKVDLSKSTKLKSLTCEFINCEINISQCAELEELILDAYLDDPVQLDISNNRKLQTLRIGSPKIIVSSFKNNSLLKKVKVFCLDDPLDFSSNTLLENLSVTGGGAVNLSQCKSLVDLYIEKNCSNTINLQQFNALKNVVLLGCKNLTSLNMSSCQILDSIYLSTIFTDKLDLDISNCKKLRVLHLDVDNLSKVNAAGCTTLKHFIYQDSSPYLNTLKWNLTSLDMSNCTSLISLLCNKNKIKELNVSGCTSLTTLSCSENQIENLNVNGCIVLNHLTCNNNKLKELDVHSCLEITYLFCRNNDDLKTLILNKNHKITTLDKDDHTEIVLKE